MPQRGQSHESDSSYLTFILRIPHFLLHEKRFNLTFRIILNLLLSFLEC